MENQKESLKQPGEHSQSFRDRVLELGKQSANKFPPHLRRTEKPNIPSGFETIWVKILFTGFWGNGESKDFCAVYQGVRDFVQGESASVDESLPSWAGFDDKQTKCVDGCDEEAVFVVNIDLMKPPIRLVPIAIRLKSVNDMLRSGANSLYLSALVGFVDMGGFVNGELVVSGNLGLARQYEFADHMVKRRAQIMDGITNQNRPSQNGSVLPDPYYEIAKSSIFVVLDGKLIRLFVKKLPEFRIQLFNMLFGPI